MQGLPGTQAECPIPCPHHANGVIRRDESRMLKILTYFRGGHPRELAVIALHPERIDLDLQFKRLRDGFSSFSCANERTGDHKIELGSLFLPAICQGACLC